MRDTNIEDWLIMYLIIYIMEKYNLDLESVKAG